MRRPLWRELEKTPPAAHSEGKEKFPTRCCYKAMVRNPKPRFAHPIGRARKHAAFTAVVVRAAFARHVNPGNLLQIVRGPEPQ